MNFLVILGPPGSGKGTLSRQLQDVHQFTPISTGEVIRQKMADPLSEVGKAFAPFMDRGDYIPDSLALDLFQDIITDFDPDARVALDGFPRTVPQAEIFADWIKQENHHLVGCVFLDVAVEIAIERMNARLVCPNCRSTFPRIAGHPAGAACLSCGGELMPREDDDPVRMRQRMLRHDQVTAPLRDWFQQRNQLLALNAGQTTTALREEIENTFNL
ncbi:nucleoside monophosphate kinase [Kiritimatiellota bacterium B12222]|nr:nucleoside monophosphate kinase [Kiritimatiellota bacterium B12222]